MKKFYILHIICFLGLFSNAQRKPIVEERKTNEIEEFRFPLAEKKERYKIAVLTPMYLDSVEWSKNLTQIPKFMMPGLDFYQGIMIAADTLKKQNFKFDLYVYDSKSSILDVKNLIASDKLDSMDLIIGNASVSDLKLLADFAKKNLINFVSAVSPSDAGQEFNPYFTILQPRLASHIEKIHKHMNKYYPEDNMVFIHRSTNAEINALSYYKDDVLNNLSGRFSSLELKSDEIDLKQLRSKIDSNYNSCIVLGIMDPALTYKLLKSLQPLSSRHKLKVYCMPTSEAIKQFNKTDEFPGMNIYYTTSYIIDRITPASLFISREYKQRMGGSVTDIVYKGFESLYYFAHLLKRFGNPFNERIGDNSNSFITPYKIVPIKEKGKIKFFENKFLYLVHYEDGIMNYE
ncbi:MAG: hypothetical protein E6Q89_00365 [Bacteroidia bacterium]|nr:MAG: hypothetical protein E6Q89_00365 [Bacteroidia bacterium]